MSLGDLLKSGRIKQGFSFQDVVDRTGYNLSSLKKYERAGDNNGAYPPMEKLARLSALYKVDPREIFAVCAENDIDTRVYYETDNRQHSPEKISNALKETNTILRQYGFSALKPDEMESFSDEETDHLDQNSVAAHETLTTIVTSLGIEARCLPNAIKEARTLLKSVEPEDLFNLSISSCRFPEEYSEDFFSFQKELQLPLKQREAWCLDFSELIITNALYGMFLWYLDKPSITKLFEKFNLPKSNSFHNEHNTLSLMRQINDSIIERDPPLLHDETQFNWTLALHDVPESDEIEFLSQEELKSYKHSTIRFLNKYGASIEENEKPEESSLTASSSGSNPITPHTKENNDGRPSD